VPSIVLSTDYHVDMVGVTAKEPFYEFSCTNVHLLETCGLVLSISCGHKYKHNKHL
jgi:hypothetical protein